MSKFIGQFKYRQEYVSEKTLRISEHVMVIKCRSEVSGVQ